jgi:hypothetical protein
MKTAALILPVASVVLIGCAGEISTPDEGVPAHVLSISDGAHAGNTRFYFLPPLLPAPVVGGIFDANLSPIVEVCVLAGSACLGPALATFSRDEGTGGELLQLIEEEEMYFVPWHTGDFGLDPAKFYRIRVVLHGLEVGHADVDVIENGKALKNVNTGDYVPLIDGRTLPVKFRLEQGVDLGLLAWWPADGDAMDHVGSNHGMLEGGAGFAPGIFGQGFALDGIDDFVQAPSPVINTPPYSVCLWAEPVSVAHENFNRYLVANGGETGQSFGFFLYLSSFDFAETRWGFGARTEDLISSVAPQASIAASAAVWTFLCGVWDGSLAAGSIRLYVDGELAASTTPVATSLIGPARNLRIGWQTEGPNAAAPPFAGIIDDVRVFGRALTGGEITALAQGLWR